MVYFLLFWLSSIRTSVSFLASSRRQQSVVQAASSGQEWTGLERSAALHWLGPAKIAVNQDKPPPKPASQLRSRHPQPKPLLKPESNCELQTTALQRSSPGQQEASSCWTGCHSPPLLAAGHTQQPACLPCPAGMLGCIVRT